MAPQKLTDYERKRLDNIRRNDEMMAALKLHSKATQLSNFKRERVERKSYGVKSEKKPKTETPIVIRRSLRTRGIPPDSKGLDGGTGNFSPTKTTYVNLGPLSLDDARESTHSDSAFVELLSCLAQKEAQAQAQAQAQAPDSIRGKLRGGKSGRLLNDAGVKKEEMETSPRLESLYLNPENIAKVVPGRITSVRFFPSSSGRLLNDAGVKKEEMETSPRLESLYLNPENIAKVVPGRITSVRFFPSSSGRLLNDAGVKKEEMETSPRLESLYLNPENIAKVVPGRITSVRFFPSSSVKMIAAGNKFGNVGFWNVGESEVHLYRPHRAPISGILMQPHCYSKIYTSCYDGILRLMDAEKEIFDLVFDTDESIYALSQPTNETNCLYLAEGFGGFTIWDNRIGKRSSHWVLHENRINTIDFNCENPHIVATSSTDRTACTWDLRYTDGVKLTALRTFTHKGSVQSAYFSPSGCSLATTSLDNTIGIYSGVNLEDAAIVNHNNRTGRWLSTFRARWGWDDSYLFVGNMNRGVDVVSAVERKTAMTLKSPHMSAIPCRFDTHTYEVGMLVGATSGGQVYIWTQP